MIRITSQTTDLPGCTVLFVADFLGALAFGLLAEDFDLFHRIIVSHGLIREGRIHTSNCHLSTCSPVSLLVITTTSFEIFPPCIHSFNWDMIFLM